MPSAIIKLFDPDMKVLATSASPIKKKKLTKQVCLRVRQKSFMCVKLGNDPFLWSIDLQGQYLFNCWGTHC